MNKETRLELIERVERLHARVERLRKHAADLRETASRIDTDRYKLEQDLKTLIGVLEETERVEEPTYYPFKDFLGFVPSSFRFWRNGFIYILIVVAVTAVFFTLFSDVPTDTP